MSFIDYQTDKKILVMTKGHPFSRDDFCAVIEGLEGLAPCFVEQPAAQVFFNPELAKAYSAFVLYDMPGMDFLAKDNSDGRAPRYIEPEDSFKKDFMDLLEQGHGFVFLHHSVAAWPSWPEYAEIVGGKFLYKPDVVRGVASPDNGYRHDITHNIEVIAEHPVTQGLPKHFSICDELYLNHCFSNDVTPLLVSDYDYTETNFYSAQQAVQGNMYSQKDWQHPAGNNIIGWVKHYANSPIVYLQCGDSKPAYDNPNFQHLLSNAINWVASDEAKNWAKTKNAAM